jgi:hypothetical protein
MIIVSCVGGPWDGEERQFRATPVVGSPLTMIEYTDNPRDGHYQIELDAARGVPIATWVPRNGATA